MSFYTEMWDKLEKKYEEFSPYVEEYKKEANMKEAIFLGRGGQGVWTMGELFGALMVEIGKYTKVIFIMTGERRAAITRSFVRYSDKPISFPNSYIYMPDDVVVNESSLLNLRSIISDYDVPALLGKLRENNFLIINTTKSPKELGLNNCRARIVTIDATSIALKTGLFERDLHTNTTMLGTYLAVRKLVEIDQLERVIPTYHNPRSHEIFKGLVGGKNIEAARLGYENFKVWEEQ